MPLLIYICCCTFLFFILLLHAMPYYYDIDDIVFRSLYTPFFAIINIVITLRSWLLAFSLSLVTPLSLFRRHAHYYAIGLSFAFFAASSSSSFHAAIHMQKYYTPLLHRYITHAYYYTYFHILHCFCSFFMP